MKQVIRCYVELFFVLLINRVFGLQFGYFQLIEYVEKIFCCKYIVGIGFYVVIGLNVDFNCSQQINNDKGEQYSDFGVGIVDEDGFIE